MGVKAKKDKLPYKDIAVKVLKNKDCWLTLEEMTEISKRLGYVPVDSNCESQLASALYTDLCKPEESRLFKFKPASDVFGLSSWEEEDAARSNSYKEYLDRHPEERAGDQEELKRQEGLKRKAEDEAERVGEDKTPRGNIIDRAASGEQSKQGAEEATAKGTAEPAAVPGRQACAPAAPSAPSAGQRASTSEAPVERRGGPTTTAVDPSPSQVTGNRRLEHRVTNSVLRQHLAGNQATRASGPRATSSAGKPLMFSPPPPQRTQPQQPKQPLFAETPSSYASAASQGVLRSPPPPQPKQPGGYTDTPSSPGKLFKQLVAERGAREKERFSPSAPSPSFSGGGAVRSQAKSADDKSFGKTEIAKILKLAAEMGENNIIVGKVWLELAFKLKSSEPGLSEYAQKHAKGVLQNYIQEKEKMQKQLLETNEQIEEQQNIVKDFVNSRSGVGIEVHSVAENMNMLSEITRSQSNLAVHALEASKLAESVLQEICD
ncbi:HARE-HTH domain-containing protein [Chloropicon primus]|uniref:HTH HARE-type domain-containing protein n=1 Tax=Chloropicon primus TaxID=1764295 RepID=A0A5B8MKB1_9CHLO|nr:hypothetical protein A3770_03p23380 [Chloropicon primus]UPQ99030.1 HARE-HTH domain-containing protein [Chloropicon primus]|eukprot:QDZ19820.1 hypothetical protein A3770_03p23380 [Chloropicon primus]